MIKVSTVDGQTSLDLAGNVKIVAADICVILHAVFKAMAEEDLVAAALFATLTKQAVDSGVAWFGADAIDDDEDEENKEADA